MGFPFISEASIALDRRHQFVIEQAAALANQTLAEYVSASAFIRAKYHLAQRSRLALDKACFEKIRPLIDRENAPTAELKPLDDSSSPVFCTEALNSLHDIANFDCGIAGLNEWLKHSARPSQTLEIANTYVISDNGKVCGYYALMQEQFEEAVTGYTLASTVLLRLAVSTRLQNAGLGRRLVKDAICRFSSKNNQGNKAVLLVQAQESSLLDWYAGLGFCPLPAKLPVLFFHKA